MKQLIEDYKRRLATAKKEIAKIDKSKNDSEDITLIRLGTKASEYRTFISDLERLNVQNDNVQTNTIQPDETPQLVSRIDFSTLRTQKGTLIDIIDDLEKRGVEPEKVSDLDGILNLIDSIQDFAVDVVGLNPINVFDFELEESREDVIKPAKTVNLCATCNTDDVMLNKIDGGIKGYCLICGKEVNTYQTELKADAKIIGYQVLTNDDDSNIHPNMETSFCVYSLKQARKMIKDSTHKNWIVLSVWSGDIEDPKYMFHGDPDNNHKK